MQKEINLYIVSTLGSEISSVLYVLLFSIFVLPFLIYCYFDFFCALGVVTPFPKSQKRVRLVKPQPAPEPEYDPDRHGTWNDRTDHPSFNPNLEPEIQTDTQLIEDAVSALQQMGFKKSEAKLVVLKVCEGKVFEDHESLIKAALDKSNL